MPLYSSARDISLFRHINRELLQRIIEQEIGYYKINLDKTDSNLYGESIEKIYNDPVLIHCLIERNPQDIKADEFGPDINRLIEFRFLRDILVEINVVPEIGDIILWNNDYYEVDNVKENQLFMGKDPSYSYTEDNNDFGTSLSVIVSTHYIRPEKLNIKRER